MPLSICVKPPLSVACDPTLNLPFVLKGDPPICTTSDAVMLVEVIFKKLLFLSKTTWKHNLGDGKASERIYIDIVDRLLNNNVANHKREDYHLETDRSYREDDIEVGDT